MTSTSETFESLVDEFRRLSHEDLEKEVVGEGYPLDMYLYPGTTQPYDASGPPYKSPWVLTESLIKDYAASIGDDNPSLHRLRIRQERPLRLPHRSRYRAHHGQKRHVARRSPCRRLAHRQLPLRHRLGVLRRTACRHRIQDFIRGQGDHREAGRSRQPLLLHHRRQLLGHARRPLGQVLRHPHHGASRRDGHRTAPCRWSG